MERARATARIGAGCVAVCPNQKQRNVDLDEQGDVVGFDIDHASRTLDLCRIETIALPPASAVE